MKTEQTGGVLPYYVGKQKLSIEEIETRAKGAGLHFERFNETIIQIYPDDFPPTWRFNGNCDYGDIGSERSQKVLWAALILIFAFERDKDTHT